MRHPSHSATFWHARAQKRNEELAEARRRIRAARSYIHRLAEHGLDPLVRDMVAIDRLLEGSLEQPPRLNETIIARRRRAQELLIDPEFDN